MVINVETLRPTRNFFPAQPFSLDFHSARLTDEQFEELCHNNNDLKFELSAKGELIIVPPTSPESGWKNTKLTSRTDRWSEENPGGIVFDSSTMFTFPNGAKRSPDVAWMTLEKWNQVSLSERQTFSRVVPDFVIELLSPTDSLIDTQAKMKEYIENGVRLGWLIDPIRRQVHIHRTGGDVEILDDPAVVSGEDVLPAFELDVSELW